MTILPCLEISVKNISFGKVMRPSRVIMTLSLRPNDDEVSAEKGKAHQNAEELIRGARCFLMAPYINELKKKGHNEP